MRPKYEYVIKETGHVTEKELNYYGELGWELVQVIQQPSGVIKMIFKKSEPNEKH